MATKDKVHFAGEVTAQEAAHYLESIARGLRERSMLLESGDTSITLDVPDAVKIEVDVSSDPEKGKSSIEVTLGWRRQDVTESAPPAGLLIVAGAAHADTNGLSE